MVWYSILLLALGSFAILCYRLYLILIQTELYFITWVTLFIWNVFPAVWFFTKLDIMGIEGEAYILLLVDLGAKTIFSIVLL